MQYTPLRNCTGDLNEWNAKWKTNKSFWVWFKPKIFFCFPLIQNEIISHSWLAPFYIKVTERFPGSNNNRVSNQCCSTTWYHIDNWGGAPPLVVVVKFTFLHFLKILLGRNSTCKTVKSLPISAGAHLEPTISFRTWS